MSPNLSEESHVSTNAETGARNEISLRNLRAKLHETQAALRAMCDAYERRVRSECTTDDLKKVPWRCAEYAEAERVLKMKLLFDNDWLRERIATDPDD